MSVLREYKASLRTFKDEATGLFTSLKSVGLDKTLGVYEGAVDSFKTSITELVKAAPTNVFSKKVIDSLLSSVTKSMTSLEAVARARDAIATRIETAKSLVQTVVDSVFGGINITSIGQKADGIIKTLKRTVAQTMAFTDQIKQLRELGLNDIAMKQILDAGAQAGGATAKALLEGGPAAINEINSLYGDLNNAAMQLGDQGAAALYGAGVDVSNGLVNGLLAQQSELERAAIYLANAFETAFNKAVKSGANKITMPTYSAIQDTISMASAIGSSNATSLGPVTTGGAPSTFNITIQPGLITDPVSLGSEIVNAITRYESTNGRVYNRVRG